MNQMSKIIGGVRKFEEIIWRVKECFSLQYLNFNFSYVPSKETLIVHTTKTINKNWEIYT
jgi:hypothetical protein